MSNSKLKELVENFKKEKKILQDQAKSLFLEASKELFNKNPEMKSFGWEQYAPYFNDGDPCVFSVHSCIVNGYNVDYESSVDGQEPSEEEYEILKQLIKPVEKLVHTLPKDIMEEVFGADTRVTITPDGKIENDEVSHD